jgi:hypothetical protein
MTPNYRLFEKLHFAAWVSLDPLGFSITLWCHGGLEHLCYHLKNLEFHLAFFKSVATTIIRPRILLWR